MLKENSEDPDQTLHSAFSKLGMHCLSISHKKQARHIGVNNLGINCIRGSISVLFSLFPMKHYFENIL